MSEMELEHCDWCGDEAGPWMTGVWSEVRGERLRVHAHCKPQVEARDARVAKEKFDTYFAHLSPEARDFLAGTKPKSREAS